MSRFKGAKEGDIIKVETKAESGYAIAKAVTDRGVEYEPIGGDWQRQRIHREPATARQIKGVYRRLRGVSE